jgi:hypothetical protein
MEKKELTSSDVWAMFAETDRLIKESREDYKIVAKRVALLQEETAQQMKETDRKLREIGIQTEQQMKETDRKLREIGIQTEQQMEETDRKLREIGIHVDGISKSNGAFAEEFFYNSLEKNMEFAGIHYDCIKDNFKGVRKMLDGSRLEDQFDIVMVNNNAVAIIEIKYKADSDDVEELATRKIKNFRVLYPEYRNFDVYLGLGTLSFNEYVVKKAKEFGVGLLKLSGEVVEYRTDWVRAFREMLTG